MRDRYIEIAVVYENEIQYKKVIYSYKEEWNLCLTGEFHREDGPAVIYDNGYKAWWKHGKIHREDGPAIECLDGRKEYYLNGIYYPDVNSPEELLLASIIK
jgi:hypothetical protein